MKSGYGKRLRTMSTVMTVLLLAVVAGACSNGNDEALDLLKDSKIGLSHLNDEFHTIKGEDLLANPQFGLAHLNEEFHTIKGTLADPKFGMAHLNDEFHTIKQTLADLSEQAAALQK